MAQSLLALLQGATLDAARNPTLVSAIVVTAVAVKAIYDHYDTRKRDQTHARKLEDGVSSIGSKLDLHQAATRNQLDAVRQDIAGLSGDVRDLTADVKGTDGEGGMRADLRAVTKRVIGLEDRERERLTRGVGHPDRRSSDR